MPFLHFAFEVSGPMPKGTEPTQPDQRIGAGGNQLFAFLVNLGAHVFVDPNVFTRLYILKKDRCQEKCGLGLRGSSLQIAAPVFVTA